MCGCKEEEAWEQADREEQESLAQLHDKEVVGATLLETQVQFADRSGPELVKLLFHSDGSVSYSRPFGRHVA